MKTLLFAILLLVGFNTLEAASIKYYDDYPDNANPPGTFKLSIQTLDKTQGGIPYNYMTLDQFVNWLGQSGFTNGSGTIIVTNASFQYITNLYAYLTNIFSTNIITTNLFATFESITYATNVTLSVSNFSYTISKGGSLISTNTSFFTTNIVNTTINTNNSFVNNEYVTNFTVVVPGGLTNLNATPKTAAWWDPSDALQSIPNASGVFTNNGSGDMGWSSTFSLTELDAQNAYLTNTFLFLTNKLLSTDGNGQATNAVIGAGLTFTGNQLVATGVTSLADATNEVIRQINSGTNIYVGYGSAISDLSKGTNEGFGLKTNNVGGGAFVFGGPGTGATLYDTNITAATTLKLFDITACGATAGGFKLYCTCSGGTDRILTFPAGCSGAGLGTPPAVTITNAKAAFFDVIYKPGATPVTNVFWSPVY